MPRTRILRQDAGLGAEIAHALSQQAAADQAFLATPGSYYRLGAF